MSARQPSQTPAWRHLRWLVLAGAVAAVAVMLIFEIRSTTPSSTPGTTVFPVGNRMVLRFVHSTGSVHLRPGPGGQVSVTEHRSGFTAAIHTRYRQRGDVITVTVSIATGLPLATWVDFDVAIPQQVTAKVATGAGTLTAAGLADDIVLNNTSGSIWARNDNGAIGLATASGSINTSKVSGQVSASTDNGTITTNSTRLRGHSVVRARSGTINFQGRLEPGCDADFRNTNGAIAVRLPGSSRVLVDARTPHGSINSQFPSVRPALGRDGSRVARGRIGRAPPAPTRLSIRTINGSIGLNR